VVAAGPLGVYFNSPEEVPEDELLWEIQWPLGGDVAPGEPDDRGFGVKHVEQYDAASTIYKGPYENMSGVYGALVPWIMENGYEIAGPAEEVYLNDPGSVPKEELLTEARFIVKKK
jgi:effector-binding domain-containing protein